MRKKIILFLLSSILLAGCAKDTDDQEVKIEKDCGCDATITDFIIPEDEPLKAKIIFVEENIAEEMSFKYLLVASNPPQGSGGGVDHFYICNEELISLELKREDIQDSVYFSGKVSKICDKSVRTTINLTINHIILTKLEKK